VSFPLDPPLLFAAGALIERRLPSDRRDLAEAATLGVFFGGSFGLYNNVLGPGVLWRRFSAQNGRDFMWNNGVFGVNTVPKTGDAGWPPRSAPSTHARIDPSRYPSSL
jgi:hypothetical protein